MNAIIFSATILSAVILLATVLLLQICNLEESVQIILAFTMYVIVIFILIGRV